ncbi:hypothetical protein DB30_01068 [Enhygromyxa salina]|uniref:HTH cro/C1-type domain-containing protein n=1 Tax=Enhygromyxa salina TaxID=215803 RepID=A0A0C2CSY7_9BACT|nr:helix-turn-helix transcriptional regulator [Enhygromyxa salina]KIG12710.1 hypothetical protein DB30_01068 [Enhygromyxa salina]
MTNLRQLAADWLEAGAAYRESFISVHGDAAVVWVKDTSGAMSLFTCGEYADDIIATVTDEEPVMFFGATRSNLDPAEARKLGALNTGRARAKTRDPATGVIDERVKRARKAAGLTLQQLADHVGVTKSAASKWECGTSQPTVPILQKIARATGRPMGFFCGDD